MRRHTPANARAHGTSDHARPYARMARTNAFASTRTHVSTAHPADGHSAHPRTCSGVKRTTRRSLCVDCPGKRSQSVRRTKHRAVTHLPSLWRSRYLRRRREGQRPGEEDACLPGKGHARGRYTGAGSELLRNPGERPRFLAVRSASRERPSRSNVQSNNRFHACP